MTLFFLIGHLYLFFFFFFFEKDFVNILKLKNLSAIYIVLYYTSFILFLFMYINCLVL